MSVKITTDGTMGETTVVEEGGVYLYLEGVRVVARAKNYLREAGAETEEEEQRGDVE